MSRDRRGLDGFIGLAVVGSAIVGIAGFLAALAAFLNGDAVGAGVLLVASALALGLLANALVRS